MRKTLLNPPHDATAYVAANTHCRNCNYDLSSVPSPTYCPHCGQETSLHPPSVREFVNHFFGNYIAVHGTFAQTLWRLISRPGELTVDYLSGRKRRYILPLRLYLTISVIVFVIFGVLASSGQGNIRASIEAGDMNTGHLLAFGDEHRATFKDGKVTCEGLPEWLCDRLKTRFGSSDGLKRLLASLPDRMVHYWAYAMFFLVPVFALLLKIFYVNRRYVYGEHLVFALHLHAFWLLAVAVAVGLPYELITLAATLAVPTYAILAMRRTYVDGWGSVLLRAFAISLIYLIVAMIAVGVVAVVALLI
jgi:hypothetical protein